MSTFVICRICISVDILQSSLANSRVQLILAVMKTSCCFVGHVLRQLDAHPLPITAGCQEGNMQEKTCSALMHVMCEASVELDCDLSCICRL